MFAHKTMQGLLKASRNSRTRILRDSNALHRSGSNSGRSDGVCTHPLRPLGPRCTPVARENWRLSRHLAEPRNSAARFASGPRLLYAGVPGAVALVRVHRAEGHFRRLHSLYSSTRSAIWGTRCCRRTRVPISSFPRLAASAFCIRRICGSASRGAELGGQAGFGFVVYEPMLEENKVT